MTSLENGLSSVDITPRDERTVVLGTPTANNKAVSPHPPPFDLTSTREEAQPSRFLLVSTTYPGSATCPPLASFAFHNR